MFDAVFFDFGGVILSSPFEAFAVYEQRVGLPPDAVRTINATNPDDNAWARFERSEIDVAEFVATFEREALELGFELSGADVLACLDGELRPEMVDVVRRCSADYTTALLTNNVVTMDAANLGANSAGHHAFGDVLSVFDVIVESSVVGRRKPQPEFYELACELAEVEPSRRRVPRRPRDQPQAGTRHGHDDHQGRHRLRCRHRRARAPPRHRTALNRAAVGRPGPKRVARLAVPRLRRVGE
ncbi:MAG: HAD family hydrolase [Microthrixaceae bacterium]